MQFIFILIFSTLACTQASAQLVVPEPPIQRQITDMTMVIQFGSHPIEVLPTKRAVKQANGQYTMMTIGTSEAMTKDKLAIGYSYASNAHVLLNGEISVKLRTGYSLNALGHLSKGAKLLVPPNLFVLNASTPLDLVRMMSALQTHQAVDWVEPFIIRNRLTE
jgi:hypothetical protein